MVMEQTLEIQLKTHKMSRLTDQQLNDVVVRQYGNTFGRWWGGTCEVRMARLCLQRLHACKHRTFMPITHLINVTIGKRLVYGSGEL